MKNATDKADRLKHLAHQFRAISEVAEDLAAIGSLEQATQEATRARAVAVNALTEAQDELTTVRATIIAEREQALVASERARAELVDTRATIQRETEGLQRTLVDLNGAIASRRAELDAVETQIAQARKRVADFMGQAA
ncbi:MAG: hypothetical protein JWM95_1050 [Gemmatimonadetes bacterium]|nr:hypothetical protein [Gemmatimonadota bacterium]